MNQAITIKREQFRVEIRKQQLECTFNKNRMLMPNITNGNTQPHAIGAKLLQIRHNVDELKQFKELNYTLICKLIVKAIQNIDQMPIEMLSHLTNYSNILGVDICIYMLEQGIFSSMLLMEQKDFEYIIDLVISVAINICIDEDTMSFIFKNKHIRDQMLSLFNHITKHLQFADREKYWKLMEILASSHFTPFIVIKNLFALNCQEIVVQRNQLNPYNVITLLSILNKYRNSIQVVFLPILLDRIRNEGIPLECIYQILQCPDSNTQVCSIMLRIINLVIQNIKSDSNNNLEQLITPMLMSSIKQQFNKHENTLLLSVQLLISIAQTNQYGILNNKPSMLMELIKLLELASMAVKVEVLKVFYILISYTTMKQSLMDMHFLTILNNIISKDDQNNDLKAQSLKCLYKLINTLQTKDVYHLVNDGTLRNRLNNLSLSNNTQITYYSTLILDTYFM